MQPSSFNATSAQSAQVTATRKAKRSHLLSTHTISSSINSSINSYQLIFYQLLPAHLLSTLTSSSSINSYQLIFYQLLPAHLLSTLTSSSSINSYQLIFYQLLPAHLLSTLTSSSSINSYQLIFYQILANRSSLVKRYCIGITELGMPYILLHCYFKLPCWQPSHQRI